MPCHLRKSNIMEDKETTSPPDPSLESDGQGDFFPSSGSEVGSELDEIAQVIDDSGHVSNLVHQFYFIKLWPTDPDSIYQIQKQENVVKNMNLDIREITERITEKMSERDHLDYTLESLNYPQREWRSRVARKRKTLSDLYMALDELCFVNKAANGRSNKPCFKEELDNNSLKSMMLHASKSLAEEKQILRDINIQQGDVASFKSLEVLKQTIRWNPYLNNWQKLMREIEQFQIQWEKAAGNASAKKGKISNYESLKKAVKDEIKLFCDDSLEDRKQWLARGTSIRRAEKELEEIDRVIYSLREKLTQKELKKGEAYQRILKMKKLYDGEVIHHYQYCSLINKVNQPAEEKDVAALDELSHSEVGKFMLEWNNNKAFREDYGKKVMQSLERWLLSRDGRRRLDKSCSTMLL